MSSTDQDPDRLYSAREPIFPRRVSGTFRSLKWWIMGITLGIYYLLPWVRWDRGPNLPDQAVLIDLANRRFFFFWIEIWPHEFYFVAGLLIMAGLGLFLFTSALGRVWCGYTCPQTVWTDLFILTERWIEGDRNKRVRLWKSGWDAHKIRLRVTKMILWLLIAVATGGAWVFYFADAPTLLGNLLTLQAHPVAYTTILVLTATTFVLGGFMREQVCIYMCPWPRIQAAMMDEDTLTIGYREWRGEPRGKHRKAEGAENLGDCIDCNACVNVCPMGIDIRDGQQLACITCGLCIDACDDVMEKIGKPRGLVDYMALSDESRERAGQAPKPVWKHIFRLRTVLYTTLWSAVGVALVVALFVRSEIDMTVSPVRNPIFVTLSDGSIRNTYDVRVRNMHGEPRWFHITVTPNDVFSVEVEGAANGMVEVAPDATALKRVYVIAAPGTDAARAAQTDLRIWLHDIEADERAYKDTVFNGTEIR
ncbi:cytochrome c oxidase accessory protein CcoG [Rhodovulum adriaticum]|uniref:Cytochrome c oxidase accessory protein FixG n=1 Tax=Rhodovulum adriaticum TaxID=35804 RepID=A0A4V2SMJ0_RHOAD|nr:cytochrome c oxidase accessory protein CcoG [Rhodovulum adriaticum]MBK1636103.1 cytochrome c oxidase accessory protein CcoG [Rhodovulum adriaticum]TCP27486.1 cytochrome c oxidase accessory protein FixG [Rhodovulum adriaticum]